MARTPQIAALPGMTPMGVSTPTPNPWAALSAERLQVLIQKIEANPRNYYEGKLRGWARAETNQMRAALLVKTS